MCLDDQILSTYLDGELQEPWRSQVEEHLTYCTSCKGRLKSLEGLKQKLKDAEISDSEIKHHQDRVLAMLEKNYLSKPKKKFSLHRQFKFSMVQVMGAAAAFVIIFIGSLSISNSGNSKNVIKSPESTSYVEVSNIKPVKTTENSSKGLEGYSIEEIMTYLDNKGYDVTVTLKGIRPLDNDVEDVVETVPAVTEIIPVPEVVENVTEPLEETVVEPVAEPVEEPVAELQEQPVIEEPAAENVPDAVTDSVSEPETVIEVTEEPVVEVVTDVVTEVVTDVEPSAETVIEIPAEEISSETYVVVEPETAEEQKISEPEVPEPEVPEPEVPEPAVDAPEVVEATVVSTTEVSQPADEESSEVIEDADSEPQDSSESLTSTDL